MKTFLLALVFIAMTAANRNLDAKTLSWSELGDMPLPAPGERITYDKGPQQFGELRVPKGEGPFPVMMVMHGGCWQNEFDYIYMTRLAGWLTEHGVATWTIEYRRLGDTSGAWPGTFLDVAAAADALRDIAPKSHLDLKRIYAAGHSAGGQLALWLASRAKLPKSSELYRENPVAIQGVLGLAAITNLEKYRIGPPNSCHSAVEPLLGGGPDKVSSRYAETSPSQRLPLGARQVFIQGEKDPIVDAASVREYVEAAKNAGDHAEILPLPEAGHFEACVVLPQTKSVFEEALRKLVSP